MKILKRCVYFLIIILLFLLISSCNVFASSIPDEVFTKARELNVNQPNSIIILKDTVTNDYYIPFCDKCSGSNSWRYTTYKSVNHFICAGFHGLGCVKYSNNTFTTLNIFTCNQLNTNCVIQENYRSVELVPVYADNDITYYNVSGMTNGDTFFRNPVQEVVVPVLATAEELPQAMITTLTLILPVGLIVFGILLSVYIIRLLILRVT